MTHPANVLREIDYIPNMGITVPGGCNLSMRVWRPVNTLGNPIPAILEHLPHHKRDGTAPRDATRGIAGYHHTLFDGGLSRR